MGIWPTRHHQVKPAVLALAALAAVCLQRGPAAQGLSRTVEAVEPTVLDWCATAHPGTTRHVAARVLESGEAISYLQEPALVMAARPQALALRRFTVQGDIERVRFDRWDPVKGEYAQEIWVRTTTDAVGGGPISVFEPRWPAEVVQALLARSRHGFDQPSVFLGYFRGAVDGPERLVSVSIRVGSTAIPTAPVVRVSDTAQYSSHVVNLVVPGFGDGLVTTGDTSFELSTVTRKFYEHFEDSYQIIAVVPQAAHPDVYTAFHAVVQNQVDGIGLARFDRSAQYGSAGALLGVELFAKEGAVSNTTSNHELTHTWGHYFDWGRVAGIARSGHDPGAHAPLMKGSETLVGSVLRSTLRVGVSAQGHAIELTPIYARQHPLELYAMGLLAPEQVAPIDVFEDQGQFTFVAPTVGAAVTGATRTISINDIMGVHGARRGPVLPSLDRATVIVSRDSLVSGEEMSYWNFYAARLEDPNLTGVMSYEGQPSFEFATAHQVDLRAGIRPRLAEPVTRPYPVDWPTIGVGDCPGVTFEEPVPTRYSAGQSTEIRGRVTATDRADFSQILIRYYPFGGSNDGLLFYEGISRSGSFRVRPSFRSDQQGLYLFEVFLFWPDAPSQYRRCGLSPIVVQG